MAKAKARGQAGMETPLALVPSLSTPSTDARSRLSGSSAPRGTSRKAQMGRMEGSVPLGEEESGDKGALSPECMGQLFHLPIACGPTHIGLESRDRNYCNVETLRRSQVRTFEQGRTTKGCYMQEV